MLDLTTLEENDLPWVNVAVMPKTGKLVMVGLETRLHVQRFEEMFRCVRFFSDLLRPSKVCDSSYPFFPLIYVPRIALDASKVLHQEMKAAIQDRTNKLTLAMSAVKGPGQKLGDDDMME